MSRVVVAGGPGFLALLDSDYVGSARTAEWIRK